MEPLSGIFAFTIIFHICVKGTTPLSQNPQETQDIFFFLQNLAHLPFMSSTFHTNQEHQDSVQISSETLAF